MKVTARTLAEVRRLAGAAHELGAAMTALRGIDEQVRRLCSARVGPARGVMGS